MAWSGAHEELLRKVNQEMDEYTRGICALSGQMVYNRAEEIAAMNFCCNQLMGNLHDYPIECVERLLQYEKPLEALRNHWMVKRNAELETEFDRILHECGYGEQESGMKVPGIS
ncbi:MAG: hypothetical protein HFG12_10460 [Oscillibacter sp.]|jgi:hypothetical protein|nr:hypothetical protein [uncultured Oscillibacter sp.]MCI8813630.1 hypothetical protein [Oscillibacter sp.]